MQVTPESIVVREYIPEDYNFILSTWLKGFRYGNEYMALANQTSYYNNYHKIIDGILSHEGTKVHVACLGSDKEVILGYSILRNNNTIVDWIFIKSAWRGKGIGKKLIPETAKYVTNLTKTGAAIIKKSQKLTFDPFV